MLKAILFGLLVFLFSCSQKSTFKTRAPASTLTCLDIVKAILPGAFRNAHDSSVELEVTITPSLMRILTTEDGTLRSLLGDTSPPEWLTYLNTYTLGRGKKKFDPRDINWDDLNYEQKLKILDYTVKKVNLNFSRSRIIKGLKVRNQLKIKFDRETYFLGRRYSKGVHTIDLSKVLGGEVHMRSPEDIKKLEGLELHFRSNVSAGRLSIDDWNFLKGVNVKKVHQHIHMVSKMPLEKMKAHPYAYPAMMSDFYRRSSLAAEILDIALYGNYVRTIQEKGALHFDSTTPSRISAFNEYLVGIGQEHDVKLSHDVRMGWVGARGHDTYDGDELLWGLEYRSISASYRPEHVFQILTPIQQSLQKEEYGISLSRMKNWLRYMDERSYGTPFDRLTRSLWYRDGSQWRKVRSLPKSFQESLELLDGEGKIIEERLKIIQEKIKLLEEDRFQVSMIFHDWSFDTLVFKNKGLIEKIERVQKEVISSLLDFDPNNSLVNLNTHVNRHVVRFLRDSGLADLLLESVGINSKILNDNIYGL